MKFMLLNTKMQEPRRNSLTESDNASSEPPKIPKRKISNCQLNELDTSEDPSLSGHTEACTTTGPTTMADDVGMDLSNRFHHQEEEEHQEQQAPAAAAPLPAPEDSLRPRRRVSVTRSYSPTPRLLSRDSVHALLHDFYDDLNSNARTKSRECWKAFYEKYHSPSYVMVRPSGNPLPSTGFIDMFCCEDVQLIRLELVSIDSVQVMAGGLAAIAIYTVDQRFVYKGELQEDRVALTCVVEERDGDIKICHEHRSTGQPIPKGSRWDNNTIKSDSVSQLNTSCKRNFQHPSDDDACDCDT